MLSCTNKKKTKLRGIQKIAWFVCVPGDAWHKGNDIQYSQCMSIHHAPMSRNERQQTKTAETALD